ncbi:MAG: ribulose-phosphate 3-epimerase [Planctomycetes bacterium]|jgi:ribulose-phosphate 3-epimerase|nr:ribulose-phosphate 3-epimerase [Planctomycetota bacterium]MBT4029053.1 ribulose-phosphate 3-epimerase [Planctomycetota bacterium]MBT4560327.1 ribulose-phosphate 3-epimerase [Planctomycetota bacterium]MBT5101856.1 ribulose-phosphate 3-epimerase [Planctomycetota bacterium]MBT5119590.1 ribulose-phosphate 3-epimerase [Planctomycetota bacterium]
MSHPIRIAPSLLACDFAHLADELQRAEKAGADWHHVDVMDGNFVPNLSIGPPVVQAIRASGQIPLDVHLMITEPKKWADIYAKAGADVLTFHYEAAKDDFPATLEAYRATGCVVGVAVNPPCGVEPLRDYLDQIDMILVMSVHAGFGGQSFMPEVLDKVRQLRAWGYSGDIQIDGGVTDQTAPACIEAGANVLVAGTYLFRSVDMALAMRAMRVS